MAIIPGRRVRPWGDRYGSDAPPDPDTLPDGVYGHWYNDKKGAWVLPEYTSYSDYSGSLIERSNLEVFKEQFAEYEDKEWVSVHGGHGTQALLVRVDADERVPEIEEFFNALENYPFADDDHHSNLEQEVADESWDSFGRKDFVRWLREATEAQVEDAFTDQEWEEVVDSLTDGQLDDLWWTAVSNGNGEEVRHEDAVSTYFDFEAAFRDANLVEEVRATFKKEDWGRLLADYIGSMLRRGLHNRSGDVTDAKRIEALPAETKQAFFEYLKRSIDRRQQLDFLHLHRTLADLLVPTQKWTQADWAIFLDVLEMEGAAAFEPGHAGRRFGRR